MDYESYRNPLKYPRRTDFSEVFFYSRGETVGNFKGDQKYEIDECASKHPTAVRESVIDEDAYRKACDEYNEKNNELAEQFVKDLLNEYGVPDDEFTRELYSIAYERGHSSGYREIANVFDDFAKLYFLAQRVYSKK